MFTEELYSWSQIVDIGYKIVTGIIMDEYLFCFWQMIRNSPPSVSCITGVWTAQSQKKKMKK